MKTDKERTGWRFRQFGLGLVVAGWVLGAALPAQAIKGGYKDGLYIETEDGDYKLKTNIQLQPQYQFDVVPAGAGGNGKTNTFQIRRARVIFTGNAFNPELTYKLQIEIKGGRTTTATQSDGGSGPNLKDAYINYDTGWLGDFQVRVGQFKPYFNFEELTSSSKLQFVDRGLCNEVFSYNRDIGIALHGNAFEDNRLTYATYVTNDVSRSNFTNANLNMLVGARLVYAFLGENKYTQSDVEDSEAPNLAVGVAASYNRATAVSAVNTPTLPPQIAAGAAAFNGNPLIATTADLNVRWKGFSFMGAGYYMSNYSVGVATATAAANTFGFTAQTGYFIVPKHFELAARFNGVVPYGPAPNGYEVGGSVNYYFFGHKLKWQTDYNLLINTAVGINASNGPANITLTGTTPGFVQGRYDNRIRSQVSLYF